MDSFLESSTDTFFVLHRATVDVSLIIRMTSTEEFVDLRAADDSLYARSSSYLTLDSFPAASAFVCLRWHERESPRRVI